jgi:hypothetical protein
MDQRNKYESTYPAATDVFSRNWDNIVLTYGTSDRSAINVLAFQVARSVRRVERVFDAFSVADGSTKEFGWFGEDGFSRDTNSPGDEVFSIEQERDRTIQEWTFAVPQDGVYVGVQCGDGDVLDGLAEGEDRGRGLSAEDLDQRAGVLSDFTYVDNPTVSTDSVMPTTALSEKTDQGIIRIDSEQDGPNRFYFGFNNQSGGSQTIDVIGRARTYHVRPVQDETTVLDMLEGAGYNRAVVQYGPLTNTNPNLPRQWYNYRVQVDAGEIRP